MEKSTYSDFAYFYAAYNQGWMHRSSKRKYKALNLSTAISEAKSYKTDPITVYVQDYFNVGLT